MMFRSATLKLTAWYMAIIILIGAAFSIVVYRMAVDQLQAGLTHQSDRFSNEFPAFSNNPQFSNRGELREGKRIIIRNLAVFDSFVLICAGFASYGLARRTMRPMELAHEQQKRFTADVSHELRTPLTALRMESEVALMDPKASKEALRHALHSNIEEADKLQTLVNNLLRLTKLETDELKAGFTNQKLDEIAQAAINQLAKSASDKAIKFDAKLGAAQTTGDASSLVQLIVILLDNAIKYSPRGSTITVTTRMTEHDAEVKIVDEGAGIDPAALRHVFDRFYRADKARGSANTEGFGLGLSIAKHIADIHEGKITLSSRIGKGTTAVISLPKATQTQK